MVSFLKLVHQNKRISYQAQVWLSRLSFPGLKKSLCLLKSSLPLPRQNDFHSTSKLYCQVAQIAIEFTTSAVTFIIFPFIFRCFSLGACISVQGANFGASSLRSKSFKSRKGGFAGNCIPCRAASTQEFYFPQILLAWLQSLST